MATTSPLLRALQEPKLARAVIAVLEHPGASYSVDSLASLAGMSRTSFAIRFADLFGQGPMDFVQKVRLRIAARLLTATDLPVKVVASSVGYASRTAFSRVFELTYGLPPSDFRSFGGGDEVEPQRVESLGHVPSGDCRKSVRTLSVRGGTQDVRQVRCSGNRP